MSAEKPTIVLAMRGWTPGPWLERFSRAFPEREVRLLTAPDAPLPPRYYLCPWKPDPAIYRREPRPLAIFSLGAGVDHITRHDPPAGVPIGRVVDPDLSGRMAEYVTLHVLWHFRQMTGIVAAQRESRWISPVQPAAPAVTVGLLGVGEMGQAAAKALQALGFCVVGWGRGARSGLSFRSFHGPDGLDALLGQTDILVSLLPSTPETRGLIDAGVFARLRRPGPIGGPCFVSAGRGDSVHEADLLAALTDGTLRAASLDVFHGEPLEATSPFWSLPNVLVTPHNAADSSPDAIVGVVRAEIDRFESGQPLHTAIDPARGY